MAPAHDPAPTPPARRGALSFRTAADRPARGMQAAALWLALIALTLPTLGVLGEALGALRLWLRRGEALSAGLELCSLLLVVTALALILLSAGDLLARRGRRFGLLGLWLFVSAASSSARQLGDLLAGRPAAALSWALLLVELGMGAALLWVLWRRPDLFRPLAPS